MSQKNVKYCDECVTGFPPKYNYCPYCGKKLSYRLVKWDSTGKKNKLKNQGSELNEYGIKWNK